MESSEMDSDKSKRGTDTSDKMVEDSETNPDLAPIVKGISDTIIESDSADSESDSDSSEDIKPQQHPYHLHETTTKPNKSTEDKHEIVKFQVYMFFKNNPETEEEKKMRKSHIHRQIKIQHEKCRELQDLALGNTKPFQLMKKCSLRFSKELSIDHTFQELTSEAENLMLEYGMCVNIDSLRRDPDDLELESEKHLDKALKAPHKTSYADVNFETLADFRPMENCVNDVLMVHLDAAGHEEKVRKRIKVQAQALEDLKARKRANEKEKSDLDAKEREMQSNMEISDAEDSNPKKPLRPRTCYYRVYMNEEILNHRINFLKAVQEMVRLSLRLFRRFNKEWLKPGETLIERTLEQVKKQMRERIITVDKRYFWNSLEVDVKGDDKETCRPNEATASFKETMPSDEKGASPRNPHKRIDISDHKLMSAEEIGKHMDALHNAVRISLSSDSFLQVVPVPDVDSVLQVPDVDSVLQVPDVDSVLQVPEVDSVPEVSEAS